MRQRRLSRAWAIGIAGYVSGIALSAAFDIPTGLDRIRAPFRRLAENGKDWPTYDEVAAALK